MSDNGRHINKAPDAFRTISEASDEIGVAPHVLRFWEGKFPLLKPLKRAGGRRFYRAQDMAFLRGIKLLLQDKGYTIKGVQKLIKDNGIQSIRDAGFLGENIQISAYENDDFDDLTDSDETIQNKVEQIIVPKPPVVKTAPSSGLALRRALARLEQARHLLDSVIN